MNTKSKPMTSNLNSPFFFWRKSKCFFEHLLLRKALKIDKREKKNKKVHEVNIIVLTTLKLLINRVD